MDAAASARESAAQARRAAEKSLRRARMAGSQAGAGARRAASRRRQYDDCGKVIRTAADLASPIRNVSAVRVRPRSAHAVLTRGSRSTPPIHSNEPPPTHGAPGDSPEAKNGAGSICDLDNVMTLHCTVRNFEPNWFEYDSMSRSWWDLD